MENETLKAIKSLDDRLASIELILKVIANNSQQPGRVGSTSFYFPLGTAAQIKPLSPSADEKTDAHPSCGL